jgi:hypothetical protein
MSTAKATAAMAAQFAGDPEVGGPGTGFAGNIVIEIESYDKPKWYAPFGSWMPTSHRQFNLSGWKVCDASDCVLSMGPSARFPPFAFCRLLLLGLLVVIAHTLVCVHVCVCVGCGVCIGVVPKQWPASFCCEQVS